MNRCGQLFTHELGVGSRFVPADAANRVITLPAWIGTTGPWSPARAVPSCRQSQSWPLRMRQSLRPSRTPAASTRDSHTLRLRQNCSNARFVTSKAVHEEIIVVHQLLSKCANAHPSLRAEYRTLSSLTGFNGRDAKMFEADDRGMQHRDAAISVQLKAHPIAFTPGKSHIAQRRRPEVFPSFRRPP